MGTTSERPEAKPAEGQLRGGRGARERILRTAAKLFYEQGVNATGMEQLTDVAHVSKRTFYLHFPSKEALVEAYLHRFRTDAPLAREHVLTRTDVPARERLLAMFERPDSSFALRGCPFHNVAVEIADVSAPARTLVSIHKREFADRIREVAAAAGASDPGRLARQLAVLFDGATALAIALNSPEPYDDARSAAEALIDGAVSA